MLFYKSGNLWKYSSNNVNYNPCSVDSAYEITDYTNLRCIDNYIYDSGWICSYSGHYSSTIALQDTGEFFQWMWNDYYIDFSRSSSINRNGYNYFKSNSKCSGHSDVFYIKRTQPRIDYKSFSSF